MTLAEYLNDFIILKTFKDTGQKKVYLVCHKQDGMTVIIKIGKSPSRDLFLRAKREVEVQNSVDSQYYPKNYDFILFDGNEFIIVEEYIESEALSDCFDKFIEPLDILKLLKHMICGLDLIWKSKITHRDLKPDNILIKVDNTPVIIDLGIVLAEDKTMLTSICSPFGPCTPSYAAPEQLKNRRADIDHRTDQFVLGIDILQLIGKGNHPFDPMFIGYGMNIPENIIYENFKKDLLDDPKFAPMKHLVVKLLAPEPFKRFRNTEAIMIEINNCIGAYNEA
ncbi:MAG: protein kinase [Desulfobulbaceae bacterium]|nr:protein kinase [Desulfobulbaceae bacterium]